MSYLRRKVKTRNIPMENKGVTATASDINGKSTFKIYLRL